ncbi:hypothetical protein C9J27_05815 [Photobacterium kishitanii]|uniref:Uncharacterized protein n=2 Tax=Photobacterium kishitanii TaxID=318456 RepID=A0A2T3KLR6_9GAMM|nr:hypothetical protein C9J27_05815 [Photobacterium kishitanii]
MDTYICACRNGGEAFLRMAFASSTESAGNSVKLHFETQNRIKNKKTDDVIIDDVKTIKELQNEVVTTLTPEAYKEMFEPEKKINFLIHGRLCDQENSSESIKARNKKEAIALFEEKIRKRYGEYNDPIYIELVVSGDFSYDMKQVDLIPESCER